VKYFSNWHQVGFLFFNFHNDVLSNKHKKNIRIILGINPLERKAELPQLMQFGRVVRTGGLPQISVVRQNMLEDTHRNSSKDMSRTDTDVLKERE